MIINGQMTVRGRKAAYTPRPKVRVIPAPLMVGRKPCTVCGWTLCEVEGHHE